MLARLPWLLLCLTACDPEPRLRELARSAGASEPRVERESCDPLDGLDPGDGRAPALARAAPAGGRYEVLPGVTMPPSVAARVAQIDEGFARRTGKHLVVVSGTRDPARQARAMVRVMQLGQSLTKLYEDRQAALEIRRAYDRALAAGRSTDEATAAVQATLQDQIRRGIYISAHLRAGAVDIRNTTLSASEKRAFRAAVQEVDGVRLLEEHKPPHFHLQIEPERGPD